MNNLHRHLAPISAAAWGEIEEEATRSFKRRSAARRVVDVPDPAGPSFSALTTGHLEDVSSDVDGVLARRRETLPVLELRVPFTVTRAAIDDVERGSRDSDWDPVKRAAEKLAMAEDRTVFYGGDSGQIAGIAPSSSNAAIALPQDPREYPNAVAQAMNALRLADVAGPYSLLLSPDAYTAVAETTDSGYPIVEHLQRLVKDGHIVWAPALEGGLLVSERGGDYELQLGEDVSIGYLSHDADSVTLYLEETLTFSVNTAEASVRLTV